MPAIRLAWAALALLLSAAAPAAEVEGVKLPERIQIGADGPELMLNGAGVRVRVIFKGAGVADVDRRPAPGSRVKKAMLGIPSN